MLKKRIIPTLLYRDFGLVKGIRFDSRRAVGSPMQAIKVYNLRGVDELVFLDVAATLHGRQPDFALVDDLADDCFMPLTVGGGVHCLQDVARLLAVGADKVAFNSAAVENPDLIEAASDRFGAQCIVASIDTKADGDGTVRVWTRSGTYRTDRDPVEFAREMEDRGAGELLLTSIDRDGTMEGYDIATISAVSNAVSVPVIASGGAGSYADMFRVIDEADVSAVAAASIFHFTQQTPIEAKVYLREHGVAVRM